MNKMICGLCHAEGIHSEIAPPDEQPDGPVMCPRGHRVLGIVLNTETRAQLADISAANARFREQFPELYTWNPYAWNP